MQLKRDGSQKAVSFLEPFKYLDMVLLIISMSFKVAASKISYDSATVFDRMHKEGMEQTLREETYFFAGVMVGSLLSAFLYAVFFRRKIYLLIVVLNSVTIILQIAKIILTFIDENMSLSGADKGALLDLLMSKDAVVTFIMGLTDNAAGFLIIVLLPALLTIKYRGSKFELTMAGTIIAVSICSSYTFSVMIIAVVTPFIG
jgi:hypothetical protein